jgi:DNA-binding transcriptional LysR family regulator
MDLLSNSLAIDVRRFRILREVRDHGSIIAASKTLNLTPSAVSQQITTLGREIGTALLAPHGRGVRLTPQAEILLKHAVAMDRQLELARADLAAFGEGQAGSVTIGTFATSIPEIVAPAFARLRKERPGLDISIHQLEDPDLFAPLDAMEIDLAITVDWPDGPHWGKKRYSRIELMHDPFLVAIIDSHPLARKRSIHLQDLRNEPWIMPTIHSAGRELVRYACNASGFTPEANHYLDNWLAILALVAAGGGVALVPRLAVARTSYPGVALRRPDGFKGLGRHVFATVRAGSEASPVLEPVIAMLRKVAGESQARQLPPK